MRISCNICSYGNKNQLKTKTVPLNIKIQPHIVYQGCTNTITKKFKHLGKKNVSQTKGIYKKRNIQIKCQYLRDTDAGIIK